MTEPSNKRKSDSLTTEERIPGDVEEALENLSSILHQHIQSSNKRFEKLEKAVHDLVQGKQHIQDSDEDISDDEESVVDEGDRWTVMFRLLRDYRITNGQCKVEKKENEKLYHWVRNQKFLYANTMGRKNGAKLSKEKIIKLESLGFNFGAKFKAPLSWDERYKELKDFKQRYGHCNVPFNATDPSPQAKWLAFQRKEYMHFKFGRPCLITLEQIGKLKELGVKWKGPRL